MKSFSNYPCTRNKRQPFIGRRTQSEHYSKRKTHNNESRTVSHFIKKHSASRVEKAEVMYSTPPQYHIRGAAINLLLKVYRPEESGLQGEVNAGYLYNYRNGTQGGISLLYTTPKWNIDLLYNTHYEQNRQTTDTYSHHTLKIMYMISVNTITLTEKE